MQVFASFIFSVLTLPIDLTNIKVLRNQAFIIRELFAGISSLPATMYIIVVNPFILSQAVMLFDGMFTATILVSFFSSLMMGL